MNKTTKIALLAIIPIAAILLFAFGPKPKAPVSTSAPVAKQQPAPATVATAPQPSPDPVAGVPAPLPPLPTDNKQAIDSEIAGIDQALVATDASLSADAPDSELGL